MTTWPPADSTDARELREDQAALARRTAQADLAADLGFGSTQELAAFVAAARRQEQETAR